MIMVGFGSLVLMNLYKMPLVPVVPHLCAHITAFLRYLLTKLQTSRCGIVRQLLPRHLSLMMA